MPKIVPKSCFFVKMSLKIQFSPKILKVGGGQESVAPSLETSVEDIADNEDPLGRKKNISKISIIFFNLINLFFLKNNYLIIIDISPELI